MNLHFEGEQVALNGIKLAGRYSVHVNPDWISITPIADSNAKSRECLDRANEAAAAAVTLGQVKSAPEFDDTKGQKCCGQSGIEPQSVAPTPREIVSGRLREKIDNARSKIRLLNGLYGVGDDAELSKIIYGWECRKVELQELLREISNA